MANKELQVESKRRRVRDAPRPHVGRTMGIWLIGLWLAATSSWIGAAWFGMSDPRRWPERFAGLGSVLLVFSVPPVWALLDCWIRSVRAWRQGQPEISVDPGLETGRRLWWLVVVWGGVALVGWPILSDGARRWTRAHPDVGPLAMILLLIVPIAVDWLRSSPSPTGLRADELLDRIEARRTRSVRMGFASSLIGIVCLFLAMFAVDQAHSWAARREAQMMRDPNVWVDLTIVRQVAGPTEDSESLGAVASREAVRTAVARCPDGAVLAHLAQGEGQTRSAVGEYVDRGTVGAFEVVARVRLYEVPLDAEATKARLARYCDEPGASS